MPERVSWALSVSSEKASWTAVKLEWTSLPYLNITSVRNGSGMRVRSVSRAFIESIIERLATARKTASKEASAPIPVAILTAVRSFVACAMRSPTLVLSKNWGESPCR